MFISALLKPAPASRYNSQMRNLARLLPLIGLVLVLGGSQADAAVPRCIVLPDLPAAGANQPTVSAGSVSVRIPRVVCRPVPDRGNAGGGSATQAGGSSAGSGSSRGLPSTGFELRLLLAAGCALVVVGGSSCVAARRRGSPAT